MGPISLCGWDIFIRYHDIERSNWAILAALLPTAEGVGHIGKYGRYYADLLADLSLVPIFCRRRPGVGHISKYGRFVPRYAADVGLADFG